MAVSPAAALRALDCLAAPVFVLDGAGQLQHANPAGRHMLAQNRGLLLEAGRLRLRRTVEQATFARALREGGSSRVLTFADRCGHVSMILRIEKLASEDQVIICAAGMRAKLPIAPGWSRHCLGVSPGVAAVAESLFDGVSVTDVSNAGRLPVATVRTRLKRLLARLGLSSQHALVGYLAKAAAIMADLKNDTVLTRD